MKCKSIGRQVIQRVTERERKKTGFGVVNTIVGTSLISSKAYTVRAVGQHKFCQFLTQQLATTENWAGVHILHFNMTEKALDVVFLGSWTCKLKG